MKQLSKYLKKNDSQFNQYFKQSQQILDVPSILINSRNISPQFDETISEVENYQVKQFQSNSSKQIIQSHQIIDFTPRIQKIDSQQNDKDLEDYQTKSKRRNIILLDDLSQVCSDSQNQDVLQVNSKLEQSSIQDGKSVYNSKKNFDLSQLSQHSISKSTQSVLTNKQASQKYSKMSKTSLLKSKLKSRKK